MPAAYDPRDPDIIADPYPALRALQDEDPAHWSEALGGWVLTRYADVRRALVDKRLSADRMRPYFAHQARAGRPGLPHLERYLTPWAVFNDPPLHTRLRGVMACAFNRRLPAMRPRVERLVAELLDDLEGRGQADVIAAFAYPLPASAIMVMLGAPREEIGEVRLWSDELATFVGSAMMSADKPERADEGIGRMADYFERLIAERRRRPREDMLSDLMAADAQGRRLADDELVAAAILMLFAGHETTTNLIGNGLYELIRHPRQMRAMRDAPGLAACAVAEVLRYQGPTAAMTRILGADMEMHGAAMRRGERVFAMIHAANRDPRQFAEPGRFDVRRRPNPAITFGAGIHFCLGAPLARLEGEIALPALLARFADFELLDDKPAWSDSLVLRGLRRLEVRLTPA